MPRPTTIGIDSSTSVGPCGSWVELTDRLRGLPAQLRVMSPVRRFPIRGHARDSVAMTLLSRRGADVRAWLVPLNPRGAGTLVRARTRRSRLAYDGAPASAPVSEIPAGGTGSRWGWRCRSGCTLRSGRHTFVRPTSPGRPGRAGHSRTAWSGIASLGPEPDTESVEGTASCDVPRQPGSAHA